MLDDPRTGLRPGPTPVVLHSAARSATQAARHSTSCSFLGVKPTRHCLRGGELADEEKRWECLDPFLRFYCAKQTREHPHRAHDTRKTNAKQTQCTYKNTQNTHKIEHTDTKYTQTTHTQNKHTKHNTQKIPVHTENACTHTKYTHTHLCCNRHTWTETSEVGWGAVGGVVAGQYHYTIRLCDHKLSMGQASTPTMTKEKQTTSGFFLLSLGVWGMNFFFRVAAHCRHPPGVSFGPHCPSTKPIFP